MNSVRVFKAFAVGLSSLGLILPATILNAGPPLPATRTTRSVEPQFSEVAPKTDAYNSRNLNRSLQLAATKKSKSVSDVKLDAAGYLHGVVVDLRNRPVANTLVVISRDNRALAELRTDSQGRFSAGPLGRGIYLMQSGGQSRAFRVWTPKMAPPAAGQLALLVTGSQVIRGQMPLEDFFASDAFVITGLVAAMIALPIILNNSGSKTPASP